MPAARPTPQPNIDILVEENVPSCAPDPVRHTSEVCSGTSAMSLLSAAIRGREKQSIDKSAFFMKNLKEKLNVYKPNLWQILQFPAIFLSGILWREFPIGREPLKPSFKKLLFRLRCILHSKNEKFRGFSNPPIYRR